MIPARSIPPHSSDRNRSDDTHFWNRPFPPIDDKSREAGIDVDPNLVADQLGHGLGVSLEYIHRARSTTPRSRRGPKTSLIHS